MEHADRGVLHLPARRTEHLRAAPDRAEYQWSGLPLSADQLLCAGLGYRQLSELQELQDRLLRPAQRILRRYPGTAHGNADEVHHPQCWLGALVQCLGREYGASAA